MVKFKWHLAVGRLKLIAQLATERYIKPFQSIVHSFIRATFFFVAGRPATTRDCSIEAPDFIERYPSKEVFCVVTVENHLTNMVQSVCSDIHHHEEVVSEGANLDEIAPVLKSIIVTRTKDGATVDEIIGNLLFHIVHSVVLSRFAVCDLKLRLCLPKHSIHSVSRL